jgi:hypothetical protein
MPQRVGQLRDRFARSASDASMEPSTQQPRPFAHLAVPGILPDGPVFEGPGLARLGLMVSTVFDLMIAVDGPGPAKPGPTPI